MQLIQEAETSAANV